jgi:hypothetical protein
MKKIDAYNSIITWYRKHLESVKEKMEAEALDWSKIKDEQKYYGIEDRYKHHWKTYNLILHFPPPEKVTEFEMYCIASEILGGNLEWGCYRNNEKPSNRDYADVIFGEMGHNYLTDDEKQLAKKLSIYPFLSRFTIPDSLEETKKKAAGLLNYLETSKLKK